MDNDFKLIIDSFGSDRFKYGESLKNYTAMRFEASAKLFFIAFTQRELIKIIKMCRELKIPFFVFGSGSKLISSPNEFSGLVIKNRTKNIQTKSVKGKVTKLGIGVEEALIEVESGVSVNKFVEYLQSQKLYSDKFTGLPGTIGGNLFLSEILQNAAESIKVLDSDSEIEEILSKDLSIKSHIKLQVVKN